MRILPSIDDPEDAELLRSDLASIERLSALSKICGTAARTAGSTTTDASGNASRGGDSQPVSRCIRTSAAECVLPLRARSRAPGRVPGSSAQRSKVSPRGIGARAQASSTAAYSLSSVSINPMEPGRTCHAQTRYATDRRESYGGQSHAGL